MKKYIILSALYSLHAISSSFSFMSEPANFHKEGPVVLQTDNNYSISALIKDVFIGGCFEEIFNIQSIGPTGGIGHFTGGNTSIGLSEGVILSTGSISNAPGSNNSESATTCFQGGFGSDGDLQVLSGGIPVFDIVGIEFDFIPTVDHIQFRYVFASEEYCEWVNNRYNDVFGFFISGPGINGSFSGGAVNLAVIPGTGDYVSINTINHVENSAYFVRNSNSCGSTAAPIDIEYDGYTKILTASINVQPCQTYHIRLVIADGGDCNLDSAVFLEANSFNLGGNAIVYSNDLVTQSDVSYEGCQSVNVCFERSGNFNINTPLNIQYSIAGTASNEIDYVGLPNNQVTIPAGQLTRCFQLTTFLDGEIEGIETITIELDLPCSCSTPFTTIKIADTELLQVIGADKSICVPETDTLSIEVSGGVLTHSFQWSTGATTPDIVVPSVDSVYSITVTDACGNSISDSFLITAFPQPHIQLEHIQDVTCFQADDGKIDVTGFDGTPPYSFHWSTGQIGSSADSLEGGIHSITILDMNSCRDDTSFFVFEPTKLEADILVTPATCYGYYDGQIIVSALGGTPPYLFSYAGEPLHDNTLFNDLPSGNHSIILEDANGCELENNVFVDQPPQLIVDLGGDKRIKLGEQITLSAIVTNPYPRPYLLIWNPDLCDGCREFTLDTLQSAKIKVTVVDTSGCYDEDVIHVFVSRRNLLYIPNAFSPNGDGVNERFTVYGGPGVKRMELLHIFDRWGELIYEEKDFPPGDPDFGWDGYFRGQSMPPGVYVCRIIAGLIDDSKVEEKRDLILIR